MPNKPHNIINKSHVVMGTHAQYIVYRGMYVLINTSSKEFEHVFKDRGIHMVALRYTTFIDCH